MKILDAFKKKKTEDKIEVKPQQPQPQQPQIKKEKEGVSRAYQILKTPQVTEKATDLARKNQYVFKVYPKANKIEIKKAIEDLYGIDVVAVRIIEVPKKRRRLGRIEGWRKGYKKAIVKIKKGQKIEVLPR